MSEAPVITATSSATAASVTFSTIYSTILVNANSQTSSSTASPLFSVIPSRFSTTGVVNGLASQAFSATSTVSGPPFPINPLTTLFTPPATCLSSAHWLSYYTEVAPTEVAECYPGAKGQLTFSPGICPSGYTVGLQNVIQYQASSQDAVVARVTELRCCPRLLTYDVQSDNCATVINQAIITGTPPQLVTRFNPFSSVIYWSRLLTVDTDLTVSSVFFTYSPTATVSFPTDGALRTIRAPPFVAQFQSTDTVVASVWGSILAPAFINGPATSATGRTSGPSISGGAIAGIVVGAIVFVIISITALFFLLRRRKKRKQQKTYLSELDGRSAAGTSDHEKDDSGDCELSGDHVRSSELGGAALAELQTGHPAAGELPTMSAIELPADPVAAKVAVLPSEKGESQPDSPTHWLVYGDKT